LLTSGIDANGARDLTLGNVTAANGGRIEAGLMTLAAGLNVTGGNLELVSATPATALTPGADLLGKQATGLPIAFSVDGVSQGDASRITVATGALLSVLTPNGASVQLQRTDNNFAGGLSIVSGTAGAPWATPTPGSAFAVQARARVAGDEVNVAGAGIVADVVDIAANRLATVGSSTTIVARLPYDSTAGTAISIPALTLQLRPDAFNQSFPFGSASVDGAIRIDVGSRAYGNRTLALDAGFLTVLPRGGAKGSTAVLLVGPTVSTSGGYRFFSTGASAQADIPIFYNSVLPTTPQVENSISATVAVSEGARKTAFDEAVRTENVAVRLRAGVIAEVGPAPSATTVGKDANKDGSRQTIKVPESCPPAVEGGAGFTGPLSCQALPSVSAASAP
jgi:hypothetical protein